MGGGINDVDRGICEAPTGLDSPGFQATLLQRMQGKRGFANVGDAH